MEATASSPDVPTKAEKPDRAEAGGGAVTLVAANKTPIVATQPAKEDPAAPREQWAREALTVIVVGASGDLAKKKTFPSLISLYLDGLLPSEFVVYGYARSRMSDDELRDKIRPYIVKKVCGDPYLASKGGEAEIEEFLGRIRYQSGKRYGDLDAWRDLDARIAEFEAGREKSNRLFYFAIPPNVFAETGEAIKTACMAPIGFSRMIVEKPFGRDTDSCRDILGRLEQHFDETDLFKIDHYLGKEMVQNLLVMRFGNPWVEGLFNRNHVQCITLTFKEPFGTEGRGGYFDSFGIIRDVIQNHLLQVMCLLCMECPGKIDGPEAGEKIRSEKVRVLEAMRVVTLDDVLLGQYEGYADDPTIPNKDTNCPTFAMVRCFVDNPRWAGVPIIFKAGKALDERKAEARVQFKGTPASKALFGTDLPRNEIIMQIQPEVRMSVKANIKTPGFASAPMQTQLAVGYDGTEGGALRSDPDAYSRLMLEALRGRSASFVRSDELVRSWEIFTPVLHRIEREDVRPLPYKYGSRGPEVADEWRNAKSGYERNVDSIVTAPAEAGEGGPALIEQEPVETSAVAIEHPPAGPAKEDPSEIATDAVPAGAGEDGPVEMPVVAIERPPAETAKEDPAAPREQWAREALTVIVVGASGDLAKKKTFPSLISLYLGGLLPEKFVVYGYARSRMSDDELRDKIRPYLVKKVYGDPYLASRGGEEDIEEFLSRLRYQSGKAYGDLDAWKVLNAKIANFEMGREQSNRLFYFAIPPNVFAETGEAIKTACMAPIGFSRMIVEKPFGRDTDSCKDILHVLGQHFDETDLFKIDHYLGKEMVQNLQVMRFGNPWVEGLFNRNHVQCITLTFKEPFGTEGRGGYFDSYGIIRDVIQNHLLQVMCLLCMECPGKLDGPDAGEKIRSEKVRVLEAMRIVTLDDVFLGQYEGYSDDPTIPNKDTNCPTFAMVRCFIDNPRWDGVPIIFKAGKALDERKAEARVQLKGAPASKALFGMDVPRNEIVMQIQPGVKMSVKTNIKTPGFDSAPVQTQLELNYDTQDSKEGARMPRPDPDAYSRLVLEALRGRSASFVRSDELVRSWEVFTPVLHRIERGDVRPHVYKYGSRGPEGADEWRNEKSGYVRNNECVWRNGEMSRKSEV